MRRLLLVATLFLAGCGQPLPKPECDPAQTPDSVLTCDEAVRAALGALPNGHPPITRIQFGYGSLTGSSFLGSYPAGDQPTYGVVVFTWADGSRRQYVGLTVYHGQLTVGEPAPY